jgi:hypothetical protein
MPVIVCMYLDLRRTVLGSANDPNDCASMSMPLGAGGGQSYICPVIWLSAYTSFLV